jgi:hypothetical protein
VAEGDKPILSGHFRLFYDEAQLLDMTLTKLPRG